jgi:DNA-directed RNA polymerase subunit L
MTRRPTDSYEPTALLTVKTEEGTAPLDALEDATVNVKQKATGVREAYEAAA